mmetsp:Transcript_11743/g.35429  ORF Transcript_11743/g.35429 Transcript_11743/m.35429 type:complete len:204 (+) Transcript_11743:295-906(+)
MATPRSRRRCWLPPPPSTQRCRPRAARPPWPSLQWGDARRCSKCYCRPRGPRLPAAARRRRRPLGAPARSPPRPRRASRRAVPTARWSGTPCMAPWSGRGVSGLWRTSGWLTGYGGAAAGCRATCTRRRRSGSPTLQPRRTRTSWCPACSRPRTLPRCMLRAGCPPCAAARTARRISCTTTLLTASRTSSGPGRVDCTAGSWV